MAVVLDNYSVGSDFENFNHKMYSRGKRKKNLNQNLNVEYIDKVNAKINRVVEKSSVDSGYATLTKNRFRQSPQNQFSYPMTRQPGSSPRKSFIGSPLKAYSNIKKPGQLPKLQQDVSPKFSVKSVAPVGDECCTADKRKFSDDTEMRRRGQRSKQENLSSMSLEHFDKDNVFFCVRDSKELLNMKQASSSAHPVNRLSNQSAKLKQNMEHPKSYKHPRQISDVSNKPLPLSYTSPTKNSYAALYAARQKLQNNHQRKQQNISKQCLDNQVKREKEMCGSPETTTKEENVSTYPHTLPSALYKKPEFFDDQPDPLPPIMQQQCSMEVQHSGGYESDAENSYISQYSTITTVGVASNTPYNAMDSAVTRDQDEAKNEGSYAAPNKPKITYKPYSYREYKAMKSTFTLTVGGLGPDTENDDYLAKLQKANRKAEYANAIRNEHQNVAFPQKKKANKETYVPPSKTEIANQYARRILPPKGAPKPRHKPPGPKKSTLPPVQDGMFKERVKLHIQHKQILADLQQL